MREVCFGADIGGTTVKLGLVSREGDLLENREFPTQRDVSAIYADKTRFTNMSLVNIAKAGFFSADRAVEEYASHIWNLK